VIIDKQSVNKLFQYCLALCGNREDAQDLLQESLEKYLKKSADTISEPTAYIRQTVRNGFYDNYRRSQTVYFEPLVDAELLVSVERELETLVIDEQQLQLIWKKLSPNEREVIFMWAVEEYSASEIALKLGIPRNTVLARLRRLKLKIQNNSDLADERNSL